MCFAYAFALALAKQQRDKDPGDITHYMNWISSRHKTNYGPWKQIATSLHTSVGLHYTQAATYKEIAELADMYFVQVHIFDLNGIKPDFCYHSPKRGHADHLFSCKIIDIFISLVTFKELFDHSEERRALGLVMTALGLFTIEEHIFAKRQKKKCIATIDA